MNSKDPRPPTDFLERARKLVRAMYSNSIDVLPDGTVVAQLEDLIRQSIDAANEVGVVNDILKKKMETRDIISTGIWKITKGGSAFIESRFGDDAVQLEQVGRKRRSKYSRSARKPLLQTTISNTGTPKSKSGRATPKQTQSAPTVTEYSNGNGVHE